MFQELLSIFRPGNPLSLMADEFAAMLRLTCEMTDTAGRMLFQETTSAEDRTAIYKKDVMVNKLERSIRKRVVAHMAIHGNRDLPYCLLLMSLVKDVERLGDYAKNITEILDLYTGDLGDDAVAQELGEIRAGVEEAFRESASVFADSDRERAMELIRKGKDHAQRADGLLRRIASSSYAADRTTALVLATRYYKRMGGHLLNVLTSVVMPLHKVDYYDEDEVPGKADPD